MYVDVLCIILCITTNIYIYIQTHMHICPRGMLYATASGREDLCRKDLTEALANVNEDVPLD